MPFDGNEKQLETKPDVFSLEGVTAWLEEQVRKGRGSEVYCYISVGHCLLAQYFTDMVEEKAVVGSDAVDFYANGVFREVKFPDAHLGDHNPLNVIAQGGDRTFGAPLTRARSLLAQRGE